jgi:hypothetical protein
MVTFAVGDAVEAEFEAGWLHGVVTEVVEKPRRIRVTFNPGADDEQVVAFTQKQAIAELRRGPHTPIPPNTCVSSTHAGRPSAAPPLLVFMWPHSCVGRGEAVEGVGGMLTLVCPTACVRHSVILWHEWC